MSTEQDMQKNLVMDKRDILNEIDLYKFVINTNDNSTLTLTKKKTLSKKQSKT